MEAFTSMQKSYTIDVSEKILNEAKPGDTAACMYGKAISESIPGSFGISVDGNTIRFNTVVNGATVRTSFYTPARMSKSIFAFDNHEKIKPHKARLVNLIGRAEIKERSSRKEQKRHDWYHNPETNEKIIFEPGAAPDTVLISNRQLVKVVDQVPDGYVEGSGRICMSGKARRKHNNDYYAAAERKRVLQRFLKESKFEYDGE